MTKSDKPEIKIDEKPSLFFPDQDTLLYSGCYYFKLQFIPNYIPTDFIQKFNVDILSNPDYAKLSFDINSYLKSSFDFVQSWLMSNDTKNAIAIGVNNNLSQGKAGATTSTSNVILSGLFNGDIRKLMTHGDKDSVTKFADFNDYGAVYEVSDREITKVYLPLNNMRIVRKAGITERQDVFSSVGQSFMKESLKQVEEAHAGQLGAKTRGEGLTDSTFLGHSIAGVTFETYDLDWDLFPKSKEEMNQLLGILVAFQTASLSNMNINDKNQTKWILPPKAEMGILVSNLSNEKEDDTIMEGRKFEDNSRDEKDDKLKDARVWWLKPPVNVFVDGVTIEPLENKGGVLLSPEGYPMGVKLSVTLKRTSLSTAQDLFRGDNTDDNIRKVKFKRGSNNGNPFS